MKLTAPDLARINYIAGFRGEALATITAIQLAEAPGHTTPATSDTNASNNSAIEDSYGISQINARVHTQYDPVKLLNPIYNSLAAFQVSSNGSDFGPWTTYTGGNYGSYLNEARAAAVQATSEASGGSVHTVELPFGGGLPGFSLGIPFDWTQKFKDWLTPGSGPADAAGAAVNKLGISGDTFSNPLSGLAAVGAFFAKAADPHVWAKFGLTLAAAVLILVGVLLYTRPDQSGIAHDAERAAAAA